MKNLYIKRKQEWEDYGKWGFGFSWNSHKFRTKNLNFGFQKMFWWKGVLFLFQRNQVKSRLTANLYRVNLVWKTSKVTKNCIKYWLTVFILTNTFFSSLWYSVMKGSGDMNNILQKLGGKHLQKRSRMLQK